MIDRDDSSPEMHDETLSSEDVERLVGGVSERPDLAELSTLFADVRALPDGVGLPTVSAALSEFVGVGLTPIPEPIVLPNERDTAVSTFDGRSEAQPVRRNSMIGQFAAFLGTMGGKVVVGTTVAAASMGGAHATGVVDMPFLPDQKPAEIETIDIPDVEGPFAFVEEEHDDADVLEKNDHEDDVKDELVELEDEKAESDLLIDKPYLFDDGDDYPEHKRSEKHDEDEDDEDELEKTVEVEKDEPKVEPKKKEPEKEQPKEKTDAELAKQALIAELEEEVHRAKDVVRAEATALIRPLEEERDALLAGLEEAHHALAVEWESVIESLRADLEGTEDEEERQAIEEQIDAAESSWASARVEAELEIDPRLNEIDALFDVIETERDAEIDRLLNEFRAAVDEIENS